MEENNLKKLGNFTYSALEGMFLEFTAIRKFEESFSPSYYLGFPKFDEKYFGRMLGTVGMLTAVFGSFMLNAQDKISPEEFKMILYPVLGSNVLNFGYERFVRPFRKSTGKNNIGIENKVEYNQEDKN